MPWQFTQPLNRFQLLLWLYNDMVFDAEIVSIDKKR